MIENKVDLVSQEEAANLSELKDFSEKNKFIGFFRSSAKKGININESMEFLIKTIVEKMSASTDEVLEKDRKSIVLESHKYIQNNKENKPCC